jgi:hypothetical protein
VDGGVNLYWLIVLREKHKRRGSCPGAFSGRLIERELPLMRDALSEILTANAVRKIDAALRSPPVSCFYGKGSAAEE